jgi:hypothetical protein
VSIQYISGCIIITAAVIIIVQCSRACRAAVDPPRRQRCWERDDDAPGAVTLIMSLSVCVCVCVSRSSTAESKILTRSGVREDD